MTLTATELSPPGGYENLSRLCRAAGDPLRLEILRALRRDSYGVLELCQIFRMRQPAMSHHLKVLAEAGLLYRRREGTSIFYGRSPRAGNEDLEQLTQAIFAAADALALSRESAGGVARVQAERAASSREFFAVNAQKFRAQQELIAPRAQYEDAVAELLSSLAPEGCGFALELGPGEGWLLPLLARLSRRVVAVDNAAAMLEQARVACAGAGLTNVALVLADSGHARSLAGSVDIAVANMVLHHTASPAVVLQDLATALKSGGQLLLTELCAHDQAWAHEACGDLWLGFAPDELSRWTLDAGLAERDSVYLALRNGFRIQLRVFERTS